MSRFKRLTGNLHFKVAARFYMKSGDLRKQSACDSVRRAAHQTQQCPLVAHNERALPKIEEKPNRSSGQSVVRLSSLLGKDTVASHSPLDGSRRLRHIDAQEAN